MPSGGFPISTPSLRLGEIIATFALAQDNAFGQPLESQLRSCLLAVRLCDEAGFEPEVHDVVYWVALLRYIGCTGHAHEVGTVFGDEIAVRARTLVHDAADPAEVLADAIAFASVGQPEEAHPEIARSLTAGAHTWAIHNFASGCEVADVLLQRLGFGADVREALAFTFERWNGRGYPSGAQGAGIPLAMRIVHLSQDMEAIARVVSPPAALQAARDRRDRTYDPQLADLFIEHGEGWLRTLDHVEPWDAVLDLEPQPRRMLSGAELDEALTVAADFIDLKSPFMGGHSRRCASLAADGAMRLGLDEDDVMVVRRAALVHEFGVTAVPNSIWDKPQALTRAERDRMELHPLVTEQMLRRTPLRALAPIACGHHERADGSGYHKALRAEACDRGALLLAACDVYVAMTTDRADRAAVTDAEAAAELGRMALDGRLDGAAVDAVLAAAGHAEVVRKARRHRHPGGLTGREVEVLRLAARGLTTQHIADQLFISPKTADHHIQHIYTKIGVATRAGAALWSIQNGVLPGGPRET